jgi:triosephosphate isomerase
MTTIHTPLILINFKTYAEATGKAALKLAKIAENVSRKTEAYIAIAPQTTDIERIARAVSLPIFAQHVDPVTFGSHTGHILAEAVKEAGAVGSLINHSERRLTFKEIEDSVKHTKEVGLLSVVCADVPEAAASAAALTPDIVAIEPPELIGSGIPVSKAAPEIVASTVALVKKTNPGIVILCGAGITKGEDMAAALRLGTEGVLVASGVVRAKEPYAALFDLARAAKAAKNI